MLTVLESIKLSTDFLMNKGIESPRINAELLLAKILNCKRLDLYLSFDRPLKEDEIALYREFIRRRSKFEPLQYITGSVEFYGLEFKINPSVLIPRPETEILVETILNSVDKESEINILDIGTGSGIIAISLAKFLPNANIVAIDSSPNALETAVENARANEVEKRINFILMDVTGESKINNFLFDLIISNPPYISSEEYKNLQPELRLFEPKGALTDDADGLRFYRIISVKAKSMLKNGGKIFFEMGQGQSQAVNNILLKEEFENIHIIKDYLNIDRVISGEKI